MIVISGHSDLKTEKKMLSRTIGNQIANLCEKPLYVNFIARMVTFSNQAWLTKEGKTFMDIALPYDEVLATDNIDLLMARELYKHLDKVQWLDYSKIREGLKTKFNLEIAD